MAYVCKGKDKAQEIQQDVDKITDNTLYTHNTVFQMLTNKFKAIF